MKAVANEFLNGFEFGLLVVAPGVVGRPLVKDVLDELRRMARGEKGAPDDQARAQRVLNAWGAPPETPRDAAG